VVLVDGELLVNVLEFGGCFGGKCCHCLSHGFQLALKWLKISLSQLPHLCSNCGKDLSLEIKVGCGGGTSLCSVLTVFSGANSICSLSFFCLGGALWPVELVVVFCAAAQ